MNIQLEITPLDYQIERYVCSKINLTPPESYGKMSKKSLDTVFSLTIEKFPQEKIKNFNQEIILSIRATMVRTHMISHYSNIISNEKKIVQDYSNGLDILELSKKYDGSPLNLLRIIFQKKYKTKLTKIITNTNTNMLDQHDKSQLELAISTDAYALVNQDQILKKAILFENQVAKILDKNNIKYKTQDELVQEQKQKNSVSTNTPDFLILSELTINGTKINWIDAKNFYGSDSKFIKKKIIKQTNKYIKEWGTGSIIFNLGFCSNLDFQNILLIDFESFNKF